MIEVHTSLTAYRSAIAELSQEARVADSIGDSVVVVDGRGDWPARAVAAVEAGAVGVVVADPDILNGDDAAEAVRRLRGVPIALDREFLRADSSADAHPRAAASALTATCAAPEARLGRVICDTVGWLRILSGGSVRLGSVHGRGGGVLAMVERRETGAALAAFTARTLGDDAAVPALRVISLGVTRTDVSVGPAAAVTVRHDDERGSLLVASRFESRRRLALRRALSAIADGCSDLPDLVDFASDAVVASALRRAVPASL